MPQYTPDHRLPGDGTGIFIGSIYRPMELIYFTKASRILLAYLVLLAQFYPYSGPL